MTRLHSSDRGVSTLHRVWTGTVIKILVLMVSVGAIGIGATQYQRDASHNSTAQIERQMSAQAALSGALLGINAPAAIGMMYGTGNTVAPDELRAGYEVIRSKINAAFDNAGHVMVDPVLMPILIRARETWQAMDAAVLAAPDLVASGAIEQAMARGEDPNKASIWDRYNGISSDFSTLATESVVVLQQRSREQNQAQLFIIPAILGTLLAALLLSWLAVRRMRREVLAPILELRRAALAMREAKLDHAIELNAGTVELRDLATTLNETAVALGASHRVLRDQAYTDSLTGLPNRQALTEHLHTKLTEPGDRRLGVLFVDLDDFKDVNDTLGHAAGDELLSVVARRLRLGTRGNEFFARIGGDEFAIVVDCGDHPGEALIVAERAIAALNEPVRIGNTTTTVSCSIGIATSDAGAGAEVAGELIRNADFAMYMAKSQGKNRFDVFAPSMHADMLAQAEFRRDLSQAAVLDQLVIYYQPIVDLSAGALQGFEALIRWQHPIRGLLAPSEFIALAEETGDIIEIGNWVLDHACASLAALRRDIPGGSALHMAINVSAHQITGPSFVDTVKEVLRRHDVPAEAVTLEITEAVALTNTEVATHVLAELRRHGLLIALDDFGVGYSSLRYLQDLPIDVIKIDRSFVMNREGDTDSMLMAIVTLGQSLGLEVIAEGIETPAELERLRAFDHIAGQGYLIARPMPEADATLFARSNTIAAERTQLCIATTVTAQN
ncbi:MAG: EAL domain-containing protein [Acidimicrobiales bacterium]